MKRNLISFTIALSIALMTVFLQNGFPLEHSQQLEAKKAEIKEPISSPTIFLFQ